MNIRNKSCSINVFATNLLLHFFTQEKLTNEDFNINGRAAKGNNVQMLPLDADRMNMIRTLCLDGFQETQEIQQKKWRQIAKALSKKISKLKITRSS